MPYNYVVFVYEVSEIRLGGNREWETDDREHRLQNKTGNEQTVESKPWQGEQIEMVTGYQSVFIFPGDFMPGGKIE